MTRSALGPAVVLLVLVVLAPAARATLIGQQVTVEKISGNQWVMSGVETVTVVDPGVELTIAIDPVFGPPTPELAFDFADGRLTVTASRASTGLFGIGGANFEIGGLAPLAEVVVTNLSANVSWGVQHDPGDDHFRIFYGNGFVIGGGPEIATFDLVPSVPEPRSLALLALLSFALLLRCRSVVPAGVLAGLAATLRGSRAWSDRVEP